MKIEINSVVRFHYSVAEPGKPESETSRKGEPVTILVGAANVIPGIESALMGHEAGDRLQVTVDPLQGYGEHRDGLNQRVAKKYFPKGSVLKPGERVMLQTQHGQRVVTIIKVGASVVDVDLNHPMAGRTLEFDIEVVDVRAGSDEEIAHRHAHGAGGHTH